MIAMAIAAIQNLGAAHVRTPAQATMAADALHLARRLTAPSRRQSRTMGPNSG